MIGPFHPVRAGGGGGRLGTRSRFLAFSRRRCRISGEGGKNRVSEFPRLNIIQQEYLHSIPSMFSRALKTRGISQEKFLFSFPHRFCLRKKSKMNICFPLVRRKIEWGKISFFRGGKYFSQGKRKTSPPSPNVRNCRMPGKIFIFCTAAAPAIPAGVIGSLAGLVTAGLEWRGRG